jgi:hypothetical protein
MTKDDFRRWYAVHRAAFPSLDSWIRKYPVEPVPDGPLSQRELLASWFDVLAGESLQHCLAATRELNSGRVEMPKMFDDHARVVRRMAAESRAEETKHRLAGEVQTTRREQSFWCLKCLDEGVVSAWHPETMEAVKERGDAVKTLYTAAIRCDCRTGSNRTKPVLQYNERQWLLLPVGAWPNLRPHLPELVEFLDNYRPANYDPSFDKF